MRFLFVSLFDEWAFGLRTLSAVLKSHGHEVFVAHLRSQAELGDETDKDPVDGYYWYPVNVPGADLRALAELAQELKPQIVGINVSSYYTGLARKVTDLMHKTLNVPVAWGGIDPTANPDIAIESADIICIGEGEEAVVELAERMQAGKSYTDVANLWVKEGDKIHKNPVRPLIQDLDSLPYPDFALDNKYYVHGGKAILGALPEVTDLYTSYPLMAGRGCPFSCTYCCNGLLRDLYGTKGYMRIRSVRVVVEEIKLALQRNPNLHIIDFYDDVFIVKQSWLDEFADVYTREIGLPLSCYVHPTLCTPERIKTLKRAGVVFVRMGVQTASERLMKEFYNRRGTREEVFAALHLLQEHGISVVVEMIGATPMESEEDNRATLDLLLDLPPGVRYHGINKLCIYRNYPLAKILEEKGYQIEYEKERNMTNAFDSKEARFWFFVHSLAEFPALGRETLMPLVEDAFLREHPEILETFYHTMVELQYVHSPSGARGELRSEYERKMLEEIAQLKGSRAVRTFLSLKQKILRMLGKSAATTPAV